MATVHPSRMALVPRDPPHFARDRRHGRSPSPRSSRPRSPSQYSHKDRTIDRKDRGRDDEFRTRDKDRERSGDRSRRFSRSRSNNRTRDDGGENGRGRRASPEYGDYRRQSPPRRAEGALEAPPALWRQEENMYTKRSQGGYGGGGGEFMDSRREQREKSTLSIWPQSPKDPTRSSLSPDPKRSKKSRKHRRSPSVSSSSTDSEEERRRRERKERKRTRREKEKKRGTDKGKERRRSRSRSYDRDSDDGRDRRGQRGRSRRSRSVRSPDFRHGSEHRTKSPDPRPPSSEVDMEDDWVEAPAASTLLAVGTAQASAPPVSTSVAATHQFVDDDGSDDEVGPQPLFKASTSKKVDERQYGGALLRGEGSAMAAFLQDGTDSRIPRRGEIGLSSDEIASYESVGYVMSGSRHRRMNAVRMRKENQVISAEEKRGILKLQQEERERRETILREEFQALVDDKLKSQGKA